MPGPARAHVWSPTARCCKLSMRRRSSATLRAWPATKTKTLTIGDIQQCYNVPVDWRWRIYRWCNAVNVADNDTSSSSSSSTQHSNHQHDHHTNTIVYWSHVNCHRRDLVQCRRATTMICERANGACPTRNDAATAVLCPCYYCCSTHRRLISIQSNVVCDDEIVVMLLVYEIIIIIILFKINFFLFIIQPMF